MVETRAGKDGGEDNADEVQQVVIVDRPKTASTHLTPFQGNFEPSSKEGLYHWGPATKVSQGWKFPTLAAENRVLYTDAIRDFADRFNIIIFRVPTTGDGSIAATPRTVASHNLASYNLKDYVDVLDDHKGKLKDDQVLKYSAWIFGDSATKFEVPVAGVDRQSKAIDPNVAGNDGLVNKEKLRLRRESVLAF